MKAIKATKQVTKAMELVAASKMRRAVQNAQTLKRYAGTAWDILESMAEDHSKQHPYLTSKPLTRVLALLFTSDRGLCGSLNAHLLRTLQKYIKTLPEIGTFQKVDFIAIGRRGQQFLSRSGQTVIAAFPALSNHPKFKDALPIMRLATESYTKGEYDHVVLVYSDFKSALMQEPVVKVLLPFTKTVLKDMLQELGGRATAKDDAERKTGSRAQYLLEPSPAAILDQILPQLTEVQIYQAVLETAASEHSARMVAMRTATDNAEEILGDLTLTYNQTRQERITAELCEISASKAALEA
jgi:F-type H+-transporting ATPase subunit gamma